MSAIAKIHVLKSRAALDEDSYRDLLERETGKRSSKGMSEREHLKVIHALEGLVPTQSKGRADNRASGKFAGKLQALWIAGFNLGVIDNKSDKAMMAFLKRQTGLEHHRFLQDDEDAVKAIDALKLWIRRATQNYDLFTTDRLAPRLYNDHRFQVCIHIWSDLVKRDATPEPTLTTYLSTLSGQTDPCKLTAKDWIRAMNDLGSHLRRAK